MPRMTLFAASLAMAVGIMDPGGNAASSTGPAATGLAYTGEYRSPGKPGAPVRLHGPARVVVSTGEATALAMTLQSAADEGLLTAEIKVGEGLTLVSSQTHWQLTLEDSQELILPLQIIADAPGEHYVHIFTEIEDRSGATTSRALAVQVSAGAGAGQHHYKAAAPTKAAPDLIRLPANETIH